jgi:hypothetical protein
VDFAGGGLLGAGSEVTGVVRFRFFDGWFPKVFWRAAQFPEGTRGGFDSPATGAVGEAALAVFAAADFMQSSTRLRIGIRHRRNFFSWIYLRKDLHKYVNT